MQNIKPLEEPPQFQYGDAVYPAAHPERRGRIRDMVWHFKRSAQRTAGAMTRTS